MQSCIFLQHRLSAHLSPQNPQNLLIFSSGNTGELQRDSCTMSSPAIAKNVLAVGASTSGNTRLSATGSSDIDTVAYFSSYGPSFDGRIKPELVAPGDAVRKRARRLFERATTSAFVSCGDSDA